MSAGTRSLFFIALTVLATPALAEGFEALLAKQKPGLWEMTVLGNVRRLCVTDKSKVDARDAVQNNPYCKALRQNIEGDKFEIDYSCDVPGLGNVKMMLQGTSTPERFHAEARYQLPPNNPIAQSLASQLQSVSVEGAWRRACTDAEVKSAEGLPGAPAPAK